MSRGEGRRAAHFLNGYLSIWVSGKETERFFNLCVRREIELWDIEAWEEGYLLKMEAKDFFSLKDILKKTGCKVKIRRREGLGFWWKKQGKRSFFWIGACFCLLMLWVLSNRLWSVQLEGNHRVSRDVLMDHLQKEGLWYGMELKDISIKELEKGIRDTYEEISWVSLSLEGTVLNIRMKEKDVWEQEGQKKEGVDLISPVEGIVESIFVREGTALFKPGEEVKKGDVLIEGKFPILTDSGEIKRTENCQGDGDVWIKTQITVEEELKIKYKKKEYSGREKRMVYLAWGEHRLGFDFFPVDYAEYDVWEERKEIDLWGEVGLPLAICTRVCREYVSQKKEYSKQEAEEILKQRLAKIIMDLEKKGVQILEKDVRIVANNVSMSLKGRINVLRLHNLSIQSEENEG